MNAFKQLLDLLTPLEIRRSILLLVLIILTAFVDALGVASIFPFFTLLSNPQLIETNKFVSFLYNKFNLIGINSNERI